MRRAFTAYGCDRLLSRPARYTPCSPSAPDPVVASGDTSGGLTWTFDSGTATFDHLADGDALVLGYLLRADDGTDDGATRVVTVTIVGGNEDPVLGTGDETGDVVEDAQSPSVETSGSLSFTDVDLTDAHTADASYVGSTHGTRLGTMSADVATPATGGTTGSVTWTYQVANADLQFLASGQQVEETHRVQVEDDVGGTTTRDVTVTITGVNDAPVAVGTVPDQEGQDGGTGSLDGSSYFADVDATDTATYALTGAPGSLVIDPDTGVISGTLDPDASQGGAGTTPGVYDVTVTRSDPSDASASQAFSWVVTNRAPAPNDDTFQTTEDGGVTGNVLDNDADEGPDADTLSVLRVADAPENLDAWVDGSDGGRYRIAPDGALTFEPNGDFEDLTDGESRDTTVTYSASDGQSGVQTATVTVTVLGVNDAPISSGPHVVEYADTPAPDAGEPVRGTLTASDVDHDAAQLVWALASGEDGASPYGTLSLNADGGFVFAPDAGTIDALPLGSNPVVVVGATVTDPVGASAQVEIRLSFTGADDTPILSGDVSGTVFENAASPVVGGDANVTDADGPDTFEAIPSGTASRGGYGTYSADAAGRWSYVLDATHPDVDDLDAGQTLTDTIVLRAIDGTPLEVTITITGGADPAPTIDAVSEDTYREGDFVTRDAAPVILGSIRADRPVRVVLIDEQGTVVADLDAVQGAGDAWSADLAQQPLADGTYTIRATSYDPAGNPSLPAERELVIDTVPPPAPTFDSLVTEDSTPILTGTYDPEHTEALEVTVAGRTYPIDLTRAVDGVWTLQIPDEHALPPGEHPVEVTAYDLAGNAAGGEGSVVIDEEPPSPPTVDEDLTLEPTPTVTGTADVRPGDVFTVTLNDVTYEVGDGHLGYDAETGVWTLVVPDEHALLPGEYEIVAEVVRPDGTVLSDTSTFELVVAPEAEPVVDDDRAVFGRVYVDKDADGRFSTADEPVAGARIARADGVAAVSDAEGRYLLADVPLDVRVVALLPGSVLELAPQRGFARSVLGYGPHVVDFALVPTDEEAGASVALYDASARIAPFAGTDSFDASVRARIDTARRGARLEAAIGVAWRPDSGFASLLMPYDRAEVATGAWRLIAQDGFETTLRSEDGIAFVARGDGWSAEYRYGALSAPAVGERPAATAFRASVDPGEVLTLSGYLGFVRSEVARESFDIAGLRRVTLDGVPTTGTLALELVRGDERIRLEPGVDYVLDGAEIVLMRPVASLGPDGERPELAATYVPLGAPRDGVVAGAGVRADLGATQVEIGASYGDRFDAALNVTTSLEGGEAGVSVSMVDDRVERASLDASLDIGAATAAAGIGYEADAGVSADGRIGVRLDDRWTVAVEHAYAEDSHRTTLGVDTRAGPFDVGVATSFDWRDAAWRAGVNVGGDVGPVRIDVAHDQPLSGDATPLTTLSTSIDVAGATVIGTLRLDDGDLTGELAATRRVGGVELEVGYERASGSASDRLRFGVDAPLRLSDVASADVYAAAVLTDGGPEWRGGFAVRYDGAATEAQLALDAVLPPDADATLDVLGGVSGSRDDVAYAADVDLQLLPTVEGRFGAAARADLDAGAADSDALRVAPAGALASLDGVVAEGVTTLTAHIGVQLDVAGLLDATDGRRLALRPSFAAEVNLGDRLRPLALQPRLGVVVPFRVLDRDAEAIVFSQALGRPALGTFQASLTTELRFELIDALWLRVGYGTGDTLLTPYDDRGLSIGLEGADLLRW